MMLNTYEHGWSDAIRGYKSIVSRSGEYEAGYSAGWRYRVREKIAVQAVTIALVLAIGSAVVLQVAA